MPVRTWYHDNLLPSKMADLDASVCFWVTSHLDATRIQPCMSPKLGAARIARGAEV